MLFCSFRNAFFCPFRNAFFVFPQCLFCLSAMPFCSFRNAFFVFPQCLFCLSAMPFFVLSAMPFFVLSAMPFLSFPQCLFLSFPQCLFLSFPQCLFLSFPQCLFLSFPQCLFCLSRNSYFYASPSSVEAYRDRRLTPNFELWVEILCVPTCFHMRIPKPCLSVRLSAPREKKSPLLRQYQSYISNWYVNEKVFTSTTTWEPKNLIFFSKKFEIEFDLYFDLCWRAEIIQVVSTCTSMSTSGMHRRPFEGRHLVLFFCNVFYFFFFVFFAQCFFFFFFFLSFPAMFFFCLFLQCLFFVSSRPAFCPTMANATLFLGRSRQMLSRSGGQAASSPSPSAELLKRIFSTS